MKSGVKRKCHVRMGKTSKKLKFGPKKSQHEKLV